MERGDLAEFGKNATQMMSFLPNENVGRKIIKQVRLLANLQNASVNDAANLPQVY